MPNLTNKLLPMVLTIPAVGAFWLTFAFADPPVAPKVSAFASADDLVKQANLYVASFETALASEQAFAEAANTFTRDAHTLAAVSLALALHDSDHPLKKSAAALAKAAQQLAKAKEYAAAQAGMAGIKAALDGKAVDGVELTWNQKIGSLGQMMKQVTNVNNRLRLGVRRFDRLAEENARHAALLAVLAQASSFDTHEVKDPAQFGKWHELCGQMRDHAGAIGAAIKAKDQKATEAGIAKLAQNCDQCHKEFRIEAKP